MAKQSVTDFHTYIERILGDLALDTQEKQDLREEWLQHLEESKQHLMQAEELSEKEATKKAMAQFGAEDLLQNEVKSHFNSVYKQHITKESLIWLICLIAGSIGPVLLINAQYQSYFVTAPLMCLLICYGLYHCVLKRSSLLSVSIVGLPILYGAFVYFYSSRTSFNEFLVQLVPQNIGDLAGSGGVFTLSSLHILWAVIIACTFINYRKKGYNKRWQVAAVRSSFEYWFMILLALVVVNTEILTNSAERKTIILNH
ncbi:permease prefix domain 1-containing protein [Caldalkalibacillus salinus]|uniref:permease prefix domain 1-containing protein n=1 Tax=Caldalkalibacillus salinus TaxID=2803787 RepID=UPI0019230C73|nr:permease prefix domain 1-containing protein [Caldalkalibacillus salinus]